MLSIRRTRVLMVLLAAVLIVWTAFGYAQARPDARPVVPLVLSGGDIGFRVEGHKGTAVVGRFVVRIDERWIDVEPSFGPRVLTSGTD
jgi:hypothetical protein